MTDVCIGISGCILSLSFSKHVRTSLLQRQRSNNVRSVFIVIPIGAINPHFFEGLLNDRTFANYDSIAALRGCAGTNSLRVNCAPNDRLEFFTQTGWCHQQMIT
jgi:hypothetical protein